MAARDAVRILAIGRIVIGVATLLFPRRSMGAWVGSDADTAGAEVMGRALGVRDAIFGGMLLHTLAHPEIARRWTATSGACDAVDGLAGVAVRSQLPPVRGVAGIALALGSAVAHLALAPRLTAEAETPPAA